MSIALKCGIDNCTDRLDRLKRGYCPRHYVSLKKYGDPLHVEKLKSNRPTSCKVKDCEGIGMKSAYNGRVRFPKGYCGMHYQRVWNTGGLERTRKVLNGVQRHPLSYTYYGMHARCYDKSHKSYPNYGGRGIKVCNRWHYMSNFIADMGDRPEGMTLDRIDTDGNYEPSNCRWADSTIQATNQRPRKKGNSLPTGVRLEPYGRYRASFTRYGVTYHVGMFDTAEEASKARQGAIDIVMASKNPS